jgi:hypothetical protein
MIAAIYARKRTDQHIARSSNGHLTEQAGTPSKAVEYGAGERPLSVEHHDVAGTPWNKD